MYTRRIVVTGLVILAVLTLVLPARGQTGGIVVNGADATSNLSVVVPSTTFPVGPRIVMEYANSNRTYTLVVPSTTFPVGPRIIMEYANSNRIYTLSYPTGLISDTMPLTPSNLIATAVSDVQINLNWQDNSSDESDFHIERSLNASFVPSTTITVGANVTNYSDIGLNCSTLYYYRVNAHRHGDNQFSGYSTASATTAPCKPSNSSATAASRTQINLGWQDNSPDESDFHIERSPNGSTGWIERGTVGANITSYSDTGVFCGTTFYYRVRAHRHNDGQYSGYSDPPAGGTTLSCLKVYLPAVLKNYP